MRHKDIIPDPKEPVGVSVLEYRLVLQAHASLWTQVLEIKAGFAARYKAAEKVRTRPFISLLRFQAPAMSQGRLLRDLRPILSRAHPFSVTIQDFGSLPCHTIFLQVISQNAIKALQASLKELKALMKIPDHNPHFIESPYLVVADRLLPWQYEQGWLEMSHLSFSGTFLADKVLLLVRHAGETETPFEQLATMPLESNTGYVSVQHTLFD
jgi:2'-5' RNA ligase